MEVFYRMQPNKHNYSERLSCPKIRKTNEDKLYDKEIGVFINKHDVF
jgi:hypothetical protein